MDNEWKQETGPKIHDLKETFYSEPKSSARLEELRKKGIEGPFDTVDYNVLKEMLITFNAIWIEIEAHFNSTIVSIHVPKSDIYTPIDYMTIALMTSQVSRKGKEGGLSEFDDEYRLRIAWIRRGLW